MPGLRSLDRPRGAMDHRSRDRTLPAMYPPPTTATAAATESLAAALASPLFRSAATDREGTRQRAAALAALDAWCGAAPPPAPAALPRAVEDDQWRAYEDLAALADAVVAEADAVCDGIAAMDAHCRAVADDLAFARSQTGEFVRVALEHRSEMDALTAQRDALTAFLADFTLSPAELALLSSPSSDLSPDFFAALNRAVSLEQLLKDKLDFPNNPLAKDIMATTLIHIETAHDHMFAWAQARLPVFAALAPDLPAVLPAVLAHLSRRTVLLDALLDDAVAHRRTALSRWFGDAALSRNPPASATAPGGGAPPSRRGSTASSIAAGASTGDDPERLVADVYAWVHQALASELALWTSDVGLPRSRAVDLVDRSIAGICRPLQTRIEQAVTRASAENSSAAGSRSSLDLATPLRDDPTLAYRVYHVLVVNYQMLLKVLLPASPLAATTKELQFFALRQFKDALDAMAASAAVEWDAPDAADLLPTPSVRRTAGHLRSIAATHARYLQSTAAAPPEMRPIVDLVVDPCVRACVIAAQAIPRADAGVYMVNCLEYLRDALAALSDEKRAALANQVQIYVDSLTSELSSALLTASGLAPITELLEHHQARSPSPAATLSELGLDAPTLQSAVRDLDAFLMAGAVTDVGRVLGRLAMHTHAAVVASAGSAQFLAAYRAIVDAVQADPALADEVSAMRSAEEVATLLGV
ncbi:Golgi transport complex subunit 6 [Blastocladiella emersonii ATCC 22665]|nr:Golgi transport complex subunit 6 [Blastocladiella emersonii ATCC 22665]